MDLKKKKKKLFFHSYFLVDNPVAQKLLFKQLTRLGFHVECANNGLEAVDAWINRPTGYFSMAFFDHHMPKVTDYHPHYFLLNVFIV
jgi:CheY-like chemotaxis protein